MDAEPRNYYWMVTLMEMILLEISAIAGGTRKRGCDWAMMIARM